MDLWGFSHSIFLKFEVLARGICLVPGGAATCSEGFFLFFSESSPGSTEAAMLPKQTRGTFRKHITKPSEQVAAPPSTCSLSTFYRLVHV